MPSSVGKTALVVAQASAGIWQLASGANNSFYLKVPGRRKGLKQQIWKLTQLHKGHCVCVRACVHTPELVCKLQLQGSNLWVRNLKCWERKFWSSLLFIPALLSPFLGDRLLRVEFSRGLRQCATGIPASPRVLAFWSTFYFWRENHLAENIACSTQVSLDQWASEVKLSIIRWQNAGGGFWCHRRLYHLHWLSCLWSG